MKPLNYYWRLLATGWCFFHLFAGGLLLALTVLPLVRLIPGTQAAKCYRARRVVHYSFRHFVWEMRTLGVLTQEMHDITRLKDARGSVVIANHPTLIDVVLLISVMPEVNCIVKAELWNNRYIGGVVRSTGYISNSGDVETLLKDSKSALDRGECLIIFPEGTRTVEEKGLKLQRGASHIILNAQARVNPVVIECDPPTLKKGDHWFHIPNQRPHFVLRAMPELEVNEIIDNDLMPSQASRRLTAHLTDYFNQLLGNTEHQEAKYG